MATMLLIPLFSFAKQWADDGESHQRGKGRMEMEKFKKQHPGLHCGEFRKEAQTQIGEDRDTIDENRDTFYDTYGQIWQFFNTTGSNSSGDVATGTKAIVKNILSSVKKANDVLRKEAYEAYKADNNTGHLAEAHAGMITNREYAFDKLEPYVDAGEKNAYLNWTAEFLKTLEANKSLRLGNVETRTDMHKSCYDKKSDAIMKKWTTKLDKILEKHDGDKQQYLIDKLSELVEKLIEKTESSTKPDAWKQARIDLLESFLTTLGDYQNNLEDDDDDDAVKLDDDSDDDDDDSDDDDDDSDDDDDDDSDDDDDDSDDDDDDSDD